MERPTVICLTPVKNEAWVLERFLRCASVWADYIIIADQKSTDGSQEIARQFKKVILIENPSPTYNEFAREELLIEAARNISGPRLLVALDADEALTANFMNSVEWI
jgi:glycosyltransferase involved in cell wall biosynthesis